MDTPDLISYTISTATVMSRLIGRIPNIVFLIDHAPASQYDSLQIGLLLRRSSFVFTPQINLCIFK